MPNEEDVDLNDDSEKPAPKTECPPPPSVLEEQKPTTPEASQPPQAAGKEADPVSNDDGEDLFSSPQEDLPVKKEVVPEVKPKYDITPPIASATKSEEVLYMLLHVCFLNLLMTCRLLLCYINRCRKQKKKISSILKLLSLTL